MIPTNESHNRELMWQQVSSNEELIKRVKEEIYNQQKKDDEVTLTTDSIHLATRSNTEEDNKKSVKADVVAKHVDTDTLTNPALDVVSRIDGSRTNPQDYPGKASGADNGDTGDDTFPADLKSKLDDKDS